MRRTVVCVRSLFILSAIWLANISLCPAQTASPAAVAGQGLIGRVIPKQAGHFVAETVPADNGHDVFEVESHGGKIILWGNNAVSIASALNWYLQNECGCDISWDCGDQLNLPNPLPSVPRKIRVVSPYRFRYTYNFCTHGYTMAWWSWPQWQRELDVLALHGVNLALVIEGQESVWINTFAGFGYSPAAVRGWVVDPAHLPWMEMDNMENYGGPLPGELVQRRLKLGQQILARMRELGMEPVLPGYYGMVPPDFRTRFPHADIRPQGDWCGLKRPDILCPNDSMFPKVAAAFYAAQNELLGGARFYDADPFHEGGSTEGIDIPAAGRAIFKAMNGSTWVLQSWQANPRQEMIDGLDKNKLLVLDLFCEDQENWRLRKNFNGTPWLWCAINNFGGNVDIGGRLDWMAKGPVKAMNDSARGRMSGIGALMEGSGINPALWELFLGDAWSDGVPDLQSWLNGYSRRRYGADIPAAQQAWKILAATIYNAPSVPGQCPINSAICARPSLDPNQSARAWASTQAYYNTGQLADGWKLLLDAAPEAKSSDGYRFDLCDVGRQVLANLGTQYHHQIIAAYKSGDSKQLLQLSGKMLGLIRDMNELIGTRKEFLFGAWISGARSWGQTKQEKDLCERNARELLTVWTSSDNITDYANRQWNGLLGDFYYHRWQMWLQALNHSLATGVPVNQDAVHGQIRDWELLWARQTNGHFAVKPHGDVIAISKKLFEKYKSDIAGLEDQGA